MKVSPFGARADMRFMKSALVQAGYAYAYEEVPVGAVLVDQTGTILARAYNKVERYKSQTAHAELRVIERASKRLNDWRLNGCWLYVTLEPCAMCMGLIRLSRCAGVVYGASSPLFGSSVDVHSIQSTQIIAGVRADEAAGLLKQFFRYKRIENITSKRDVHGKKI